MTSRQFSFVRLATRGLALALTAAVPLAALADTVWYGSGGGTALKAEGTILKVEGGNLVWQLKSTGNTAMRPLDVVVKVNADGEAALNAAEDAFEAEKWVDAANNYDRAITATRKEWVKSRAVFRLVAAAEKAGQFPLSAKAFAQLATIDPTQAKDKKPAIPEDKAQVVRAIPDIERAFAAKQTDLVREFLGELYIANNEAEKALRLLQSAPGADKNPGVQAMRATAALSSKDYASATDIIQKNRAIFTDRAHQLTALYTLAECAAATAGNDAAKKQDAAIAYMRVVAHFGDRGNNPQVLSSLLKAAKLLEEVGQGPEAAALYKQVAEDPRYKGSKSATDAKSNYDRLAAAAKPK